MRPAEKAWAAMGLGIAAYEIACPRGETLSEGVDRMMARSRLARVAVLSTIAITGAHLANLLPESVDPFHRALLWKELDK